MGSRSGNRLSGLLLVIVALSAVSAIYSLFDFLIENIAVVLIIAVVVGVVLVIITAIISSRGKKAAAEAEHKRNLDIINSTETKPILITLPRSTTFNSVEEESINQQFKDFIKQRNVILEATAHLEYLSKKYDAYNSLTRFEEASQLETEIEIARRKVADENSKQIAFYSRNTSFLYQSKEVEKAYLAFASVLSNDKINLLSDFFKTSMIKAVTINPDTVLLFTPAYTLQYSTNSKNFRIVTYKEVSVSTYISTEMLTERIQPDDEIEHIGYLYETKDGRRDMRYSYENNPSYTYVYRGWAIIRCGSVFCEKEFKNKSLTISFEKNLRAYISLMSGKYKTAIEQILNHGADLSQATNVETFLKQQADFRKKRTAAEKAQKEKIKQEQYELAKAEESRKLEEKRLADIKSNMIIDEGVLSCWYGKEKHLVIPSGIVTEIGDAFSWDGLLESIELPYGVTKIHSEAFRGSTALKRISMPNTIQEIGKKAFAGCSSLQVITLPTSIKIISNMLFLDCSEIKSINIPTGVEKIESKAFSGCESLVDIVIPEGVKTIEDYAFENCSSLKTVHIPNSVIQLGKGVFDGCRSLEHVVFGSGIKKIPDACFENHQKLCDVTVSKKLIEIGKYAFKNCQKLTQFVIERTETKPQSKGMAFEQLVLKGNSKADEITEGTYIEQIGESAFENCLVFEGFVFREGLHTIGDYAFANCHGIQEISFPKSICSFGQGVFSGCASLRKVTGVENVPWKKKKSFTGTPWLKTIAVDGFVCNEDYLEAYTGNEENVTIPNEVKTVGASAFEGNTFVSGIIISDGVYEIKERAFANCKNLKSVMIADSVEKIAEDAFANVIDVVIQCSRGSFASAYRIRNKIRGEYISKTKDTTNKGTHTDRKSRKHINDGLSALSEEEYRVIMEMRREKLLQKKVVDSNCKCQERTEYRQVPFDSQKVSLRIQEDSRKITNNIFNIKFFQNKGVDTETEASQYETFVIDDLGQVISTVVGIDASKSGDELTHKATYTLSAQEKFDKNKDYYIVLRYKGAENEIVSKTKYKIVIEFASDFDF